MTNGDCGDFETGSPWKVTTNPPPEGVAAGYFAPGHDIVVTLQSDGTYRFQVKLPGGAWHADATCASGTLTWPWPMAGGPLTFNATIDSSVSPSVMKGTIEDGTAKAARREGGGAQTGPAGTWTADQGSGGGGVMPGPGGDRKGG